MDSFKQLKVEGEISRLNKEAEERDALRRAKQYNLPYLNLGAISVNLDVLKIIPEDKAKMAQAAAVDSKRQEIALAVFDPHHPPTQKLIEELETSGFKVRLFITSLSGLERVWRRYLEIKAAPQKGSLQEVKIENPDVFRKLVFKEVSFKILEIEKQTSGAVTTSLVDFILGAAIALEVSDIHLEAEKNLALLRFRIDGLLYDVCRLGVKTHTSILGRLKLLSGLKINITDVPQDGRFTVNFGDEPVEIRTSVIPSEYGETVVMRVLNPKAISLSLADLGLRPDDEETIRQELKRPNGTILVTGPTGSGKTTTLYAFLKAVKSPELKIITIEDPIEYHLEGIEQTQVEAKSGYTFSSGLRSILRQDPDIILVGEIRDLETAEIGMHAALTGHLVFSTLHTNSAVGAIPRLIDLGAKPSIIGPALNLIIAQRLVRKLCPYCKVAETKSLYEEKLKKVVAGLPSPLKAIYSQKTLKLFKPQGCPKCRGGFKGRLGIFELLKCDDELRSSIAQEVTEETIKKLAIQKGMVEMQVDGLLKVIDGLTTVEEVERVTGPVEIK